MISKPEFEMKQIVFAMLSEGEKISFSNDNILIKDKEGKVKHQSTCYRLFMLCIVGQTTVTTAVFNAARRFGFIIALMSQSMKTYELLGSKMEGNTILRRKQYEYQGIDLAKHIVANKVSNAKHLLQDERHKSELLIGAIKNLETYLERIKVYDGDLAGLLGLEGLSAREFFKSYYAGVMWKGRKPRIKCDYVNCTLDIGYTLLFNFIDALLNAFGFDTYCGIMHKEFYMRKSLVCDLVEPFRCLIDKQVRKAIHLEQCKVEDFVVDNGRYVLKWKCNAKYVGFLMAPILKHKVELFLYIQDYYRAFMKGKAPEDFPVFVKG